MASDEAQAEGTKKRRLRGACDICRRQKIRCDSAKMPGNRCTNCVSFNSDCTHNLSQLKEEKGPRRKRANGQASKNGTDENGASGSSARLVQTAKSVVDGLLRQTFVAPQDRDALFELLLQVSRYARSLEHELDLSRQSQSPPSDRTTSPRSSENDDEQDVGVIVDKEKMPEYLRRITTESTNHRYFGKNSSVMFVQGIMEMRPPQQTNLAAPSTTRPIYWTRRPWEIYPDPVISQVFPPADLFRDLIDIYFAEINIYMHVLHRPTFEKAVAEGLHLRNHQFGAIVLAVCALAGKNSLDERVLLPGADELSAGWLWFRQVRRPFSGPVVEPASLYELQLCCLYILFHLTCNDVESCWLLSGIGILYAQDIGAHQRDPNQRLTIESELTKRSVAFLITFDSIASACFGRTTVTTPGKTELPPLVSCDDEYWDLPDRRLSFKQPPGKPPLSAFSAAYFELMRIFTCKGTLVSVLQDPVTVAEIDVLLNRWVNDIPEHLLWNPFEKNDAFFEQSCNLYASFYHVQIMVHRIFIRTLNSSTFKSLAICTNAARSCAQIADVKSRRGGMLPVSQFIKAAFDSAVVLLLNVFGGTRSGLSIDTARELVDVYKCMKFLRQSEHRCQIAGRFYDIICELMNTSNLPLPPTQPIDPFGTRKAVCERPGPLPPSRPSQVLPAEKQVQLATPSTTESVRSSPSESADNSPALGRANNATADAVWPGQFLSTLPMAVEDLGSLPIYGSLNSLEVDILGNLTVTPPKEGAQYFTDGVTNSNSGARSDFNPMSSFDSYMSTDETLSVWIPYFSTVDEMMQGVMPAQPGAGMSGLGI
ncbi:hypothetical protein C8R46DRAFT_1126026 [Mycena filopes]|nr:hypothetical protein C8R46DRAFT_1126026 [Mycena filopes]